VAGRLDDAALRDFSSDGEAARLARRVRLENDAIFAAAYPQRQGAEVLVSMKNGKRYSSRLAELQPLDAQGVRARFCSAAAGLLGEARAQQLDREIDALPAAPDAARLSRMLAP
jgi:hypothetical protein